MEFLKELSLPYGKIKFGVAGKQTLDSLKEKYPSYPKTSSLWKEYTKEWIGKDFDSSKIQGFTLNQVHGDSIHSVTYSETNQNSEKILEGDALYTNSSDLMLVVRTADCVPVFLYSNKRPFIAIIHSGWKGTALGITEQVLEKTLELGFDLEELQLEIGPYIQKSDYEVGDDVAKYFLSLGEDVCQGKEDGKFLLDVGKAIEVRVGKRFGNLLKIKNDHTNVFRSPLYFSHRAKEEGRNLNFILWES
ncbi:polyphenol oxidase family protein [Leptospira brenneri]|uniref:Laccase domain-containing protein n=1 Tax=Leptospira brenneri TaxID=2023182 RepID=A0A2M9Y0P1_9LEPT|nr:polyphenol oxidase family protein [Leptospira brenneri]PJZ45102.1 hypothetical protein CH361_12765 [Leptospira brenneri]TGK95122.1 laccase domain-containing protein [Leptospira brenneri]